MNQDDFNYALERQLIKHEALRLMPYRCTAGKLTIGVGRNIEERGISYDEARLMLKNDIQRVIFELRKVLPGFEVLTGRRQMALIDMCFNLGLSRFLNFKGMLAALAAKDDEKAAAEMLHSAWAKQVGERAETLAGMMWEG